MADRFEGVWLKLERAKEHINDLEAAIIAFHTSNPYQIVTEDNPQTGKRIAKIGAAPAPIPTKVPLALGDAVHCVRTALDYFAYAAIPTPTKDTAFPVLRTRRAKPPVSQQLKALVGGKLNGASTQLKRALYALQPYRGGREEYVWLIDQLDLIDKHHLLLTIGVAYSAMTFDAAASLRGKVDWTKDLPVVPISLRPAERYPVQAGTELFIADPENFDDYKDAKYSFDVAFGEPQPIIGEPVVPTLRRLRDEVENLLKRLVPLV